MALFLSSIPFLDLIDSYRARRRGRRDHYLEGDFLTTRIARPFVNRSHSVMGDDLPRLMSCSQLCLVPLQFKALCGGGDGEGGPTLSGIGMPTM